MLVITFRTSVMELLYSFGYVSSVKCSRTGNYKLRQQRYLLSTSKAIIEVDIYTR